MTTITITKTLEPFWGDADILAACPGNPDAAHAAIVEMVQEDITALLDGATWTVDSDEQPCIWQRRAEAMLPLVNVALAIADRCKTSGSRGDFIVVDFPTIREMIKVAEDYRNAAEQESQP